MSDSTTIASVATVQVGVARADGTLSLTDSEVIFEPFNQQFGLGPYAFKRSDIASVTPCLGKGGGIIPLTTDAIRIRLANAQVYEFIIAEPKRWIERLTEAPL